VKNKKALEQGLYELAELRENNEHQLF